MESIFCSLMEKGAFYGIKTIGLTKKLVQTAVDNLNITLTNGVYGLLGANAQGKQRLCVCSCNIKKSFRRKFSAERENIVGGW